MQCLIKMADNVLGIAEGGDKEAQNVNIALNPGFSFAELGLLPSGHQTDVVCSFSFSGCKKLIYHECYESEYKYNSRIKQNNQ